MARDYQLVSRFYRENPIIQIGGGNKFSPLKISNKVKAVKNFVAPGEGPRFRKRDRLAFLSRRAMRSAKDVGSYIRGGQGRKRRDMARVFKKVFQVSRIS